MGCASVTQLEMMPKAAGKASGDANPWPEWPRVLQNRLRSAGVHCGLWAEILALFGTTAQEIVKDDQGHIRALKTVRLAGREPVPGSEAELPCANFC